MAITILKKPLNIVPAYNDIEVQASTTQHAQPNFKFKVTVDFPALGYSHIYYVSAVETDKLYFNLVDIVTKYIRNYVPQELDGFLGTGNIELISVTVYVDEYYSGTSHTGTSFTFKAWNGALTKDERGVYAINNYIINTGRNNIWLNQIEGGLVSGGEVRIKSNQDLVLRFLQTTSNYINTVTIETYDSSGGFISTSYIASPDAPPSNIDFESVVIDVGTNGLNRISSGKVTGTFPILSSAVSYYLVYVGCTVGAGSQNSILKVIIDDFAPSGDNVPLFYLSRFGAFDFHNFTGNHVKTLNAERSMFAGLNNYFQGSHTEGSTYTPKPTQLIEDKVYNNTYKKNRSLQSQALSEYDQNKLQDLITSPVIYTNADYNVYKFHAPSDVNYTIENRAEMQFLKVNLKEGQTERRQNG